MQIKLTLTAGESLESIVPFRIAFFADFIHQLFCFLYLAKMEQVFDELNSTVDIAWRSELGADVLKGIVHAAIVANQIPGDGCNQ